MTMSNWKRPKYVGSGKRKVPDGVDPETLAPDGAVTHFRGSWTKILAWKTPDVWVRFLDEERIVQWEPASTCDLTAAGKRGQSVDGSAWTYLVDWPGLEAWITGQARTGPGYVPEPAVVDPPKPMPGPAVLHHHVTITADDDTLPPQQSRLRWDARTCDGRLSTMATVRPDIVPAAVLARRTPARVSTPTDLDDHLIPDAEPEGIVPRGAR